MQAPPDFRIRIAWLVGCGFFFFAFVLRVSPSVMVSDLMREFAVGASLLGNLSAFYFYSYAILQVPIGMAMDRIGPRRAMSAAAAICGLGSAIFALSTSVEMAYLGRLMIGAGAAFAYVGTLSITSQWFPAQRFALLGGSLQMFGMLGGISGQAPTGYLVAEFGWRQTMLGMSVAVMMIAVLLWLFVRDRTSDLHRGVGLWSSLRRVASHPQTWLNTLTAFTLTGPMLAIGGLWGVPYLITAYGVSRTQAAATMSMFFVGLAIAAPTLGWLSDRLGRRKPFLIGGCLTGTVCMLTVALARDLPYPVLVVLCLVTGAAGGSQILSFACVKEINPPNVSGAAIGLVNMGVVGSGAVMQPLIGVVLDQLWDGSMAEGVRAYSASDYSQAFLVLPVVGAVGLLMSLFIRETYCRQTA